MGQKQRQATQAEIDNRRSLPDPEEQARTDRLNRAVHRSVFAHLTRPVPDPDCPGGTIPWCLLDQRLRARAYRRAVVAATAADCPGDSRVP